MKLTSIVTKSGASGSRAGSSVRMSVPSSDRSRATIDVLGVILKDNTKFVLPGNADLVTVLGLDSNTAPQLLPLRREAGKEPPRPPAR